MAELKPCPFCGGEVEERGGQCNYWKKIMTLGLKCKSCGTIFKFKTKWQVNPYTEAIEILLQADKKFENPVSWGIDLSTEHERYLTDEVFKAPVFVTDYPKDIKAFYMRLNDDQACSDR